jgi:hypothetical protein
LVLHQFVRNVRACKNATNLIRGPVRMAAVMKTWGAAAGLLADVLPTLAGAAAGAGTLVLLVRVGRRSQGAGVADGEGASRRQVLVAGAGAAALAAAAGGLGNVLLSRSSVAPGQVRLPAAAIRVPVPAPPAEPGHRPGAAPGCRAAGDHG